MVTRLKVEVKGDHDVCWNCQRKIVYLEKRYKENCGEGWIKCYCEKCYGKMKKVSDNAQKQIQDYLVGNGFNAVMRGGKVWVD